MPQRSEWFANRDHHCLRHLLLSSAITDAAAAALVAIEGEAEGELTDDSAAKIDHLLLRA